MVARESVSVHGSLEGDELPRGSLEGATQPEEQESLEPRESLEGREERAAPAAS